MPRFLGTWKRYAGLNPRWWDRLSTGELTNFCWTELSSVGTVYSGVTDPTHTSDGTEIYNVQFDTSTGVFIAQYGTTGTDQLSSVTDTGEDNLIEIITFVYTDGQNVALQWSSDDSYYTGTDSDLADTLALEDGNQVCALMDAEPLIALILSFGRSTILEDA